MSDDLDNFLEDEKPLTKDGIEVGTTIAPSKAMSKADLNKSILNVYNELGGDQWLLEQAQLYPKEFMAMMKPLISNANATGISSIEIVVNDMGNQNTQIGVVDSHSNKVIIDAAKH